MSVCMSIFYPQALEFDYDVKITEPETSWKFNAGELAR